MNNASLVGIGYTQTLRPGKTHLSPFCTIKCTSRTSCFKDLEKCVYSFAPGMKLTLSALVDGKNINAGGHKLGLGLELEA